MEVQSSLLTLKHIFTVKQQNSQLCLQIIESHQKDSIAIKSVTQHLKQQACSIFDIYNTQIENQLENRLLLRAKKIKTENIQIGHRGYTAKLLVEKEKQIPKQPALSYQEIPQNTSLNLGKANHRKMINSQNGSIFSSKGQQKWELFTCFLCLKQFNFQNQFIFDQKAKYLNHLKQKHEASPEFQVIIRCFPKHIPFSHCFYQGNFIKIAKDPQIDILIQKIYNLKQIDIQSLYICGCLNLQVFDKQRKCVPIFHRDIEYFNHIQIDHKGKNVRGSSHLSYLRKKANGKQPRQSYYFLSHVNNIYLQPQQIDKYLIYLYNKLQRRTISKYNKYLLFSPLNSIYFFSSYPNLIPRNLYHYSSQPFSEVLHQILHQFDLPPPESENGRKNGKKAVSSSIQGNKCLSFENYVKQQQYIIQNSHSKRESIQAELQLSKVQLDLVNPRIFVCGCCQQILRNQQCYIIHICCEHQSFHKQNTHKLAFLPQQTQYQGITLT